MPHRPHGAFEDSLSRSFGVMLEGGRVRISDALEDAETVTSGVDLPEDRTTAELPPDVKIGRFSLLRLLGRGGMGVVYTAYDELLDRVVAIKRVRGDRGDHYLLGRVLREAKALAKLSHPNVVQIFDVGESDGQVFIAMEFVEGPTLRGWSDARRQPGAAARPILDMFIQAGRGLAAAHAAGLVHRDFKPDNVLVGPDGRPRVLDFGLVTARGAASSQGHHAPLPSDSGRVDPRLTRVGSLLGTPAYMAPEQWAGRPADARSDQFSFCAALHEALHGAPPFPADASDARHGAMLRGELQTSERALPVPSHVAAALRRGMSFRPDDRFPDLGALLAVLSADPAAVRRRRLIAAGMVVATGLLVVAVVLVLQGVRQRWLAEQREADAAAALESVDARIDEAHAAGDAATAARLLLAFIEDPAHRDTRAVARAWLDEGARRRDDGDVQAATSAYARAFAAAKHDDDRVAALLGLAPLFRARLEWDGLGRVLARLDRTRPGAADAPELRSLRVDGLLAQRDFDGARALLPADAPARELLAGLDHARATEFRDATHVLGRVRDELWLVERRDAPILRAARADATLAPLWSHELPRGAQLVLADPRAPHLVAREDDLVIYGRAPAGGLVEEYRWPARETYASTAADLDGDGVPELYIGTGSSCEIVELARDPDGAWSGRVVFDARDSLESAAVSLLAVDLDRDGRDELVAALGGWRAYDVRVLRKDPATGHLATVARDKLGAAFGLGALRGGAAEPLIVAEVFHREPDPLVFPPDRPFGAPPGTYLLALQGDRLIRRDRVPFAHEGRGAVADGVHWQPLVGDADGDGRTDFANVFEHGGSKHALIHLQGDGGRFTPVLLHDVDLLGFAQLDRDRADELLVNDTDERGVPRLWALGVGDQRLPRRGEDVPEDSRSIDASDDPQLQRGLAGADGLRGLGLFADAADAYEELSRLAAPGPQRDGVLLAAAALRERLGEDAAALALFQQAGDVAPNTEALRGAYRSQLRLGRYHDALETLDRLRERPDLPPAENATRIAEQARLAAAVRDEALDLAFDRPLPAAWKIRDPLALRRLPLASALQIETVGPGVLAELPLEWDGHMLDVSIDATIDHTEWSSALTVELVPEDDPGRPALTLAVATHGTSRGGQPPMRAFMCLLGLDGRFPQGPPDVLPPSTAESAHLQLRAFAIGSLGEAGCVAARLDREGLHARRARITRSLGEPGRYRLVLRAHADVPAWLSVQLHRITVRGAHLRDDPPTDPARDALHAALVEGDAVASLAALAPIDPALPLARVARPVLLTRVGRLAEAAPLWRALLLDDDPAVRAALLALLRGAHAEFGAVLRDISEPAYLAALTDAWRNTGVNHLDDPRVAPVFLDILSTLDPARLAPDGADTDTLLRAADLLTWRSRLHALAGRRDGAEADATRALELCERAGPVAAQRSMMLRLDLASAAARAGDLAIARAQVQAARDGAEMPLLVDDIVRARRELADLGR